MKRIQILLLLILAFSIQSIIAQDKEPYYIAKTLEGNFEEVTETVKAALKEQGFGVVTEIDMDVTLKEKLSDVDMRPYKILGVCNPKYAYQTIQEEENIGLFLPCKVLVKDLGKGKVEVVMVNPTVVMGMLGNEELVEVAKKVTAKFETALSEIK